MSINRLLLPAALALLLTACSDGNNDSNKSSVPAPSLELSLSDAPIDLSGITAEFAADVPYGDLYGRAPRGPGSSLWLGTHDDMADPDNEDPILKESTGVRAVGALATQATYDIPDWESILLRITEPFAAVLGGTDIPSVAAGVGATNYLLTFLGISSLEELEAPAQLAYRADIDMLELMDSGDAPVYIHNDEVGLHSVAYSEDPDYFIDDPSGEGLVSFRLRHIR